MAEPKLVKGPDGIVHRFPADATDREISDALNAAPASESNTSKSRTWTDIAADVATGVAKGVEHSVLDAGNLVSKIPVVGTVTNAIGNAIGGAVAKHQYGTAAEPIPSDEAFQHANRVSQYANAPEMVGGALETAAELAMPAGKVAQAVPRVAQVVPRTARAAENFKTVMSAAGQLPVDVAKPGAVALRIQELAERGGSMPMVVRKFLTRVTDPDKAPLNYEEARDFASNISRLSANEFQRLTPVVAREVANLRVALNDAIGKTAQAAGKGKEYASAMNEYAKAMRLRSALDEAVAGAKRALPYAIGGGTAGAGYYLTDKIKTLLGGE